MTKSMTRIYRKLSLLALLVTGFLLVAPERSVNAYEHCIPDYNSCNMMCETIYGPYGNSPDEEINAYCKSDCMDALGRCQAQVNPEERDV